MKEGENDSMSHNILFTSWYTGLGGGETDLLSLATHLDPQHYTPHLLVPQAGTLARRWREQGWQVHIVPYRGASTYFVPAIWSQFPIVNRIADILRDQEIALVHTAYHTLPFARAAAQRVGIPSMWTVYGWWFRPHIWQRAFFRQVPVVARTRSVRDGFLGEPPFMPPERAPIIYLGVDTDHFHPAVDGTAIREGVAVPADAPLVVMIARFQPVKGHHVFQAMARLIVQALPDVHFIVAGEDTFGVSKDQVYRQTMLASVAEDPVLSSRFHYIGFRDDVERVLAAADVVVCASAFESYGRVNLEAMAMGKALVSTNRGGPAETIIHNETGILVDPNDPQALAQASLNFLRDPGLRRQMGEQARQHIIEHFSVRATAQQYADLFNTLIQSHA